ncbi:MAG: protease inhibitor I42 family protein [Promethearchaeota archaeon]|nr:MAG: protease inhibitor I42 family protein [Candidatus Lokiarchaeota archaeon]
MNNKVIRVKLGDIFKISLDSNPTTGYQWELKFDPNYLQLEDRTYIPSNSKLGGRGREYFSFKSLKNGKPKITMQYKRSWESTEIKKEVFFVEII